MARRPWRALVIWFAIIAVCILPAANVGSVITGGFDNPLPSSDSSVQAQNAFNQEFPNASSAPSSSLVLLEAPNIVGAVGKNATLAVENALLADTQLRNVSSVNSLYSAYSAYLTGEVQLGWSFLWPALNGSPPLPTTVNQTAALLWYPPTLFFQNWESIVANQSSSTPPAAADWPAYSSTHALLAGNSNASAVLDAFYPAFNSSINGGCLADAAATTCLEGAVRASLGSDLLALVPSPSLVPVAGVALTTLGALNWSQPAAQRSVVTTIVGGAAGIPPTWLRTIWDAFPSGGPPSLTAVAAWVAGQVVQNPTDRLPLPIPTQILSAFVNPSNSATLVVVSFNTSDSFTTNGSSVTYSDVAEIDHVVTQVLAASPEFAGIAYYQTGGAPLDGATSYLATSSLSLLLILTVVVLLVIMLVYFRSPLAPLLAFAMIGIALVTSLAAIFLVGKFVTTFNSMIESIILVFLMSIGTDYSVFLLARYREELVRGTPPTKAVETTVRWAGQSITTSGLAVIVVAIALATLSGISFLNQLGICLLISVALALVVNLMVLPAILVLVGPRIFWPNSGKRFERYANRRTNNIETERDFIARAGRAATRRPLAVIGLIVILSIPVVAVAVQVPVSYDITNIGLPASNPAQVGFVHLQDAFGASYSSTSFALVTFSAPVLPAGGPNPQEFRDIAAIATALNGTPGVASVATLVGNGGASLDSWLNYSSLPPAVRISLAAALGAYVGVDGRTVLFTVSTNESGYSAPAVGVLDNARERVANFDSSHPEVVSLYFGGAAPTTKDIQSLVNRATEDMLIGAAVGLLVIMLVLLGSAFVPLLALGVIGLSILWSWAGTYFVVGILKHEALIFLLPLILLIMVMGLGMDYNVLLLTRVKEERALGNRGVDAIRDAVTHAGGVITAAAIILGGAFLLLGFTSPLGLIAAIGLGIGFAVLLQAFVVQLFFTPAVLTLGKDAIWRGFRRNR